MSVLDLLLGNRNKSKLKSAFKAAGLTRKIKRRGQAKDLEILPTIHSVRYLDKRTEFVFTLPNGVDPELVAKNDYVFKQYLGTQTEISGNLKRFVVNVYKGRMPSQFDYAYTDTDHRLPIICGINRVGELVTYDMALTPHLLITGETGAGKSTQLRSVITQLILSRGPDQLRLVLGDLKMSEFHVFRNLAHVEAVCYNAGELTKQLDWVDGELKKRGKLLNEHELTHISELPSPPPAIVVAIDEFALLREEKAVMRVVEDISAIGRALDVYLVLSQQRADKDVMNGRLKQNLTVRMAFRAADAINSRITIGSGEAAEISIEDRGRFYLKREQLEILQGPFLSVEKARALLKPYKRRGVDSSDSPHKGEYPVPTLNDPLGLLGDSPAGFAGGDDDA
ncbi:S-DNA-T family DNA segregation ATPase FtsK/SpoIIIE [Pullulanibacillus pueri]|uniref:FtsK domain-containing protein n=1 Tax=Pullulanibacillus pueri TaxID=1437324 RepID=A0A8J3ENN7_9BACL|nr:FtsK/SpoIIIE domain-containing protein [Pullulanibacillus pueri]MBM7683739.1 S-DNA-T family DNA segregation ATPase FtsK/SpoIIIE [Pullulanibacillus pueri]GGH85114.1 hypothetical protein GCM10007096_29750 [Pullulanibacillus pueri]